MSHVLRVLDGACRPLDMNTGSRTTVNASEIGITISRFWQSAQKREAITVSLPPSTGSLALAGEAAFAETARRWLETGRSRPPF